MKCPVGRSLSRASSLFGDANLCGFCFAWISCRFPAAGPNEPKQSPTRVVSRYSFQLSVLPNAAIPASPALMARGLSSVDSATVRRTGSLDPACLATGVPLSSGKCAARWSVEPTARILYTQTICKVSASNAGMLT